jgi:hypothetical protein
MKSNLRKEFENEMGYDWDYIDGNIVFRKDYVKWLEEKAAQNVCDSTRSVYPVLCAVPCKTIDDKLVEIELISDSEFSDFDNIESCKINLKQIFDKAQELRKLIKS